MFYLILFNDWMFTARLSFHQQLFTVWVPQLQRRQMMSCFISKCVGCLCYLVFWDHLPHLCIPPWHTSTSTSSPSLVLIATLGLSSLLSQTHMALQHAAHTIITSHIPWNTSATLLPPVLPDRTTRPAPLRTLNPSLTAPTFSHTRHTPHQSCCLSLHV